MAAMAAPVLRAQAIRLPAHRGRTSLVSISITTARHRRAYRAPPEWVATADGSSSRHRTEATDQVRASAPVDPEPLMVLAMTAAAVVPATTAPVEAEPDSLSTAAAAAVVASRGRTPGST